MKARAVPRVCLLSSLLFAGSWPLLAEAVVHAPVAFYCQNILGQYVTCPPPPKPAAGPTARRAYLRSFRHDLRSKQVVRLEGGSFQVLTPAEWHSDDEDAAQGWCVAQVDEQPVQRTRFYHVWLDKKSCLATRKEVIRPEPFDPFKAYAKDRIICDTADSLKCDQATKRFATLAATDLEQAPDLVFEYPTILPELRQRFALFQNALSGIEDNPLAREALQGTRVFTQPLCLSADFHEASCLVRQSACSKDTR